MLILAYVLIGAFLTSPLIDYQELGNLGWIWGIVVTVLALAFWPLIFLTLLWVWLRRMVF